MVAVTFSRAFFSSSLLNLISFQKSTVRFLLIVIPEQTCEFCGSPGRLNGLRPFPEKISHRLIIAALLSSASDPRVYIRTRALALRSTRTYSHSRDQLTFGLEVLQPLPSNEGPSPEGIGNPLV